MAGVWKWAVESKEFELVIKGGGAGLRFFERNSKTSRSIFLHRDEVAWLDNIVEKLIVVRTSEVFWDQSRAGYPRVMVQKCSNRHGKFLTLEEYDGRRRCGSVMIPEGRFGQGWDCLKMEVKRANSSLNGDRGSRVFRKVTGEKSYAEVTGKNRNQEVDCHPRQESSDSVVGALNAPATVGVGPEGASKEIKQLSEVGELKSAADGEAKVVGPQACRSPRAASTLIPNTLPFRVISGLEALSGRMESEGKGVASMGILSELLGLKNLLFKLKGDVDAGINRVEMVLGSMDCCGPHAGEGAGHGMGWVKDVGCGVKPKRKKRKNRKKKKKISPSGPKSKTGAVVFQASEPTRETQEVRSFQPGLTYEAETACTADAVGAPSRLPSILGRFEWVNRMGQLAKAAGELGLSSMEVCDPGWGLGLATQSRFEVGSSSQTAPAVDSVCRGQLGEHGESPEPWSGKHGDLGEVCGVSEGGELFSDSPLSTKGECLVAQVSGLVPCSSGDLVLGNVSDKIDNSGLVAEVLTPRAKKILEDFRLMRTAEEGSLSPNLQINSAGMELVIYADEEPIPLDWSKDIVDGGGNDYQVLDKEVELIMAFSQIVGVSCEGYFEKLRVAFAHILAGKMNKAGKRSVGGGQGGRKGLRELVNLISTVNYEGGGGSVTRSRGKGRGNRLVL
jgi:hypothetical protein